MFKINDESFEIERAYLDALLDDDDILVTGLVVVGKRIDDNTLPMLETERLLSLKRDESRNLIALAGKVVEWEKASKNAGNRPYAKLVNLGKTTTTGYLYNVKVEFKALENTLLLKLNGLCESKFNDKEIKTLSVEINTEVELIRIQMGPHENEESARERLRLFWDDESFRYEVSTLKLSNSSTEMWGFVKNDPERA